MNKTIRRNWLKSQIEKGNIEIKTDMILTDDYAFDAATKCQKTGWEKADIKNFHKDDFTMSTGRAYQNQDGTITWVMCSGYYYTCRLIKK